VKAATEDGVLEHMGIQYNQWGKKLSGINQSWVDAKVRALQLVLKDQDDPTAMPLQFLDIGVGDMVHWEQWRPFKDGKVEYLGVDGCTDVLDDVRARHDGQEHVMFLELKFSELVELHREGHSWAADCIVALDVLYHVHDDDVYHGLLELLFKGGHHKHVLVSYATNMSQEFNEGVNPGDPGYAWFPRPFDAPEGWQSIYREASRNAPQHQELQLLRRS